MTTFFSPLFFSGIIIYRNITSLLVTREVNATHPEKHLRQYKRILSSLSTLLQAPGAERDAATITTATHWASFHLISVILDQLAVADKFKHRNHRSVKYLLRDERSVREVLGPRIADRLYKLYNDIETQFMAKFQYGSLDKIPDYDQLAGMLAEIVEICKLVTNRGDSRA